jgi:hypothetical protein
VLERIEKEERRLANQGEIGGTWLSAIVCFLSHGPSFI